MPRQRRSRFTRRKANAAVPGRPPAALAKQPCCVVCYNEFSPYPLTCNSWEASMGKVFYKVLHIPLSETNEGLDDEESNEDDENESILSLPFCAQCHSKVSVMFSLYSQFQFVQEQFNSVRNDVAFTVVETISKNNRNGPMDFIRQQICEQWQTAYVEAKSKDDLGMGMFPSPITTEQQSNGFFNDTTLTSKPNQKKISQLSHGVKYYDNESLGQEEEENEEELSDLEVDEEFTMASKSVETSTPRMRTVDSPVSTVLVPKASPKLLTGTGDKRQNIIPTMPKLIPMAKLHAEARKNDDGQIRVPGQNIRGKTKKTLGNKVIVSRDTISPDISPPSPLANKLKKNPSLTHMQVKTNIRNIGRKPIPRRRIPVNRSQVKVQLHVGMKKTEIKRRRRRKHIESSDGEDAFEGLTTKDIILKQNSLALSKISKDKSVNSELHQCKLCPRQYSTQSRLMRHESVCHPTLRCPALRCKLCPKGFSSALTLRRHMQNIHHSAIEGYTMCPLCDRSFIKKYAFEVHLKTHEEQGLTIPPLSPSDMPPPPGGLKSTVKSTPVVQQRKNSTKKAIGLPRSIKTSQSTTANK